MAPGEQVNQVEAGNATAAISKICTNARESCAFVVDVNQIGDPAPGCGKDMPISWRCGDEERSTGCMWPQKHTPKLSRLRAPDCNLENSSRG